MSAAVKAPGLGRSWLDQWFAKTAEWADPVATLGAGAATALLPDVLVSVLSEGVARRFGGHRIDLMLRGQPVSAQLDSLRVKRTGASFRADTDLTAVDWNGYAFTSLTMTAHGIRLIPSLATRFETEQVDLDGEIPLAELIAGLNGHGLQWRLSVDDSGLIRAEHTRRRLVALVDASVRNDLLRIGVKRATWMGLTIPSALLTARTMPLPALPNDGRVVRAIRIGDTVRFTLDLASLSGTVDLAQVRNAIAAGTGLAIW
ncbi:hypothetical protein OG921_17635 [Aldersonia sp. NBC_00410]|uniref:hypothetical protein n=1 Tax=Aldersonia sp. NBC_00410 TaxID=2975954 RepID=UPI00225A9CC1|nr:hypothetical protein [Aldersonia sp. NBC_00410]MCX5044993.1 hypothetical protein [Aldersonia sp. NBC_00410]